MGYVHTIYLHMQGAKAASSSGKAASSDKQRSAWAHTEAC